MGVKEGLRNKGVSVCSFCKLKSIQTCRVMIITMRDVVESSSKVAHTLKVELSYFFFLKKNEPYKAK